MVLVGKKRRCGGEERSVGQAKNGLERGGNGVN